MITVKDLPFMIEQRGGNMFKVWAPPVIGFDATGNAMYGNEMVEFASTDEIKTFELFNALQSERDELIFKLGEALSSPSNGGGKKK